MAQKRTNSSKKKKRSSPFSKIFGWGLVGFLWIAVMITGYLHHSGRINLWRFRFYEEVFPWHQGPGAVYHLRLPKGFTVHGIDVSRHQGYIRWDRVAEVQEEVAPIRFILMKATGGSSLKDTKFMRNWKKAKEKGFIRGAYHFYHPAHQVDKQIANFCQAVQLEAGDLPPVLDVEQRGSLPLAEFQKNVLTTLEALKKHYKVTPILYTGLTFYHDYLNEAEFRKYSIWIARYQDAPPVLKNKRWAFWQYTDNGYVPGIHEDVDFNVYRGSLEDLKKLCVK